MTKVRPLVLFYSCISLYCSYTCGPFSTSLTMLDEYSFGSFPGLAHSHQATFAYSPSHSLTPWRMSNPVNLASTPPPLGEHPMTPTKASSPSSRPNVLTSRIISSPR